MKWSAYYILRPQYNRSLCGSNVRRHPILNYHKYVRRQNKHYSKGMFSFIFTIAESFIKTTASDLSRRRFREISLFTCKATVKEFACYHGYS